MTFAFCLCSATALLKNFEVQVDKFQAFLRVLEIGSILIKGKYDFESDRSVQYPLIKYHKALLAIVVTLVAFEPHNGA
jgi:hypothetical protein